MTARPHVVLLLNNDFRTDSRAWKLSTGLHRRGFRVTVVARTGTGAPGDREERDGVTVVRVDPPAGRAAGVPGLPPGDAGPGAGARGDATRLAPVVAAARALVRETAGRAAQAVRYLALARRWAAAIARAVEPADVWQAEGLVTLPVALDLRRRLGGRAVYDSRDVHVESARFARLPGPWRALLRARERRWARSADAVLTVSEPYAEVLARTLGVTATIVMNGPDAAAPPDRDAARRTIRARLGIGEEVHLVLSLGQVAPGRGLETLVEAMSRLPDAHLAIVGSGSALEAIRARAGASPAASRIHLLPGVSPDEIPTWNAAADVAAMPVEPTTLNHRLNTPTKLFDALGAGTPVVASDLPGMAAIVRETGAGELCDPRDPDDVARAIRTVLDAPPERRRAYGEGGLRAVAERYAWEHQLAGLVERYRELGIVAPP